jgi:Holliday junction resolvasome RuvABC ATP-dependent DNA helicase subunit
MPEQKCLMFDNKLFGHSMMTDLPLRAAYCSPDGGLKSPLAYGIIGNMDARHRLGRIAYDMMGYPNHCCDGSHNIKKHPARNIALIGGPGTGKTTFARLPAQTTELPILEVQGQSLRELNDLIEQVNELLLTVKVPGGTLELEWMDTDRKLLRIPPMFIFIDEVHTLKDRIVQGLLKATEPKDRMLVAENGNIVDCQHVFWIVATTKRGLLDSAYDSRFSQIILNSYTRQEIAQIVQLNNPDWDMDFCELITKYGGTIPRKVLLFAEDVQRAIRMDGGPCLELLKTVARQHQIDKYGMPFQVLAVLRSMEFGPVSKARMCGVAGVENAELENYIMPPLLNISADGDPPLVTIESRGFALTEVGGNELRMRDNLAVTEKSWLDKYSWADNLTREKT